jgi:outer membrane protein assembly factor BamD
VTSLGLLWLLLAGMAACGTKRPPLSELSAEVLWTRGFEAYEQEEWEEAIRYLDRFVLAGGSDPRVDQARYYAADAHFNRDEYVTAAADFARLASDVGRAELGDDARFMTCRAYQELSPRPQLDQEYTRAAIEHCQSLLDLFPESEFREEAEGVVEQMWGKLAAKAYETGEWYRGRQAYDSAILYYEDVVRTYPQTRWAPQALARMVDVFGILEWEEEQVEARERLLAEYPESPEARALSGG